MKSLITAFLFCIASVSPALADTLSPGEVLHIAFTLTSPPNCTFGPCDTLIVNLDLTSVTGLGLVTTAQLFNGSTLLGTFTGGGSGAPVFERPTSLFAGGGAVVDFSSIQNGTIHGTIDYSYSATNGSITFDPNPALSQLILTHAIGPNNGKGGFNIPIQSLNVVPEPSTLGLLLSGLTAVPALYRYRGRRSAV
jgi:hypothetical protein